MLFTIPSFIYTGRYYVDFQQVISNYTAFNTSWYGEGWFLFPFICLSLLSPWIFKLTDRYKVRWILPISFLLGTCTSFIISRYGAQYLYKSHWLYNPFLILHLAPSFIFGAMLQRTGFIHKMQEKYMVIDSLEGINSEIEKFGNMIPQTENKELKQTLKEMRNKCEMSQEQLAQIATAKNYYVPAAQASEQEIQSVKSIFQ